MTEDAREAKIREAIRTLASEAANAEAASGDAYDPMQGMDFLNEVEHEALEALASLARDARKAALSEVVVEAAEDGYALMDRINTLELTTREHEDEIRAADQRVRDAFAAYRAEFPASVPAEPQEER